MTVTAVQAGQVIYSYRDAAVLTTVARMGLAELRRNGERPHPKLLELLTASEQAVQAAAPRIVSEDGQPERPRGDKPADSVLTAAEVAFRVGRDVRTVRRWCEDGKWASARKLPGGHWVVDEADVADEH